MTDQKVVAQSWGLVTFTAAGSDVERAGILMSHGRVVVPDALSSYRGLAPVLSDWQAVFEALRDTDVERLDAVHEAIVLSPVRFPGKLLMVGANYTDHLKEMGAAEVPTDLPPYYFFLPPATALSKTGDVIRIPREPDAKVDWEAELAIVIGKRAHNVSAEDALDYVAGYSAFNDITARGYMRRERTLGPPFTFDWARAKGQDGFCPIGPIRPAWLVEDPQHLRIRCIVNGKTRQDSNTNQMIVGIRDIISIASHNWTLLPGDIIATGTPAGVGIASGSFLGDGDVVEVIVGDLPALSNSFAYAV